MGSVDFSDFEAHPSGPTVYFNGTFTYNRRSSDSTWVDCSLSGNLKLVYSGSSYGVPYSGYGLGFTINSTDDNDWHGNYYSLTFDGDDTPVNESWSFEQTSGNITLWTNCDFGARETGSQRYCDKGHDHIEMCTVACPDYNPHSDPWLDIGQGSSGYRTDRRYDRTVDYNAGGDGHSLDVTLSTGHSFNVGTGGSGTKTFNPAGCGQDYDAVYSVSGTVKDISSGVVKNSRTNASMACYGSLKCTIGNVAKMIKGVQVSIPMWEGPDKFSNDDSNINYGIYIDGTKYTVGSDVSNGRTASDYFYNFTPDTDGTTYSFKAWVQHNITKEEWTSNDKLVSTYVDPRLDPASGNDYFSPQDNATLSWSSNAGSLEGSSQSISILGSSVSGRSYSSNSVKLAPSGSYWVQSIFNDSKRSTDRLSSTLTVTLTNTESGVSTSSSKSFQVQYKPTKNLSVTSVENQGKTIAIDNDAYTTIRWTYPWNAGAAGVVSGFRVRVYSDSSYSTQVGSDHFITTTYSNFISGPTYSIDINNETEMKRGVMNYADITPYYTYPSGGTKSYGNVIQVGKLIKPYKFMAKPVIAYPINNTTWHNKQFRVLLPLNEDRDFDTYTSSIQSAYKYSDIEIKVNSTIYAFSGTYTGSTAHAEIFSSDVNKANMNNHKKLIGINPSLVSSFPDISDGSAFTISVRVQRGNYYFTDQEMQGQDSLGTTVKTWSDWSDPITLNKSSIAPQNLTVGLEIKASHYQTVHNWGLRLLACYPINSKDSGDVDQVRGNQIDGSKTQTASGSDEYEAVFRTMQNLMAGVNGYCTYDRAPVKFNSTPSFSALEEIITSAESGTDRYGSTGRNYMNLLTRYMNDYLK